MTAKPVIGITMGDPAGIGPEIIMKALQGRSLRSFCRPVIIGHQSSLLEAGRALGLPPLFSPAGKGSGGAGRGSIPLVKTGRDGPLSRPGSVSARSGRLALAAIEKAVELVRAGAIAAVVTAPISKESIRKAGSPFPGHTEMLASLSGAKRYAMMLVGGPLRVSLATIHIPLKEVPPSLTTAGVLKVIELTWETLPAFKVRKPVIAVCGLNPHAGEGGIMGSEDRQVVAPAVKKAQRKGINVSGPYPADTIYHRAARGEFAAVVAMYHDQGLIAVKTLAFDTGVNLTLGLPFIRTSVDHGTAYDIAGTGVASPNSLIAAARLAADLARLRTPRAEQKSL